MIKLEAENKFNTRSDWKKKLNAISENEIKQVANSQGITAYFNKKKIGYWDYDKNTGVIFSENIVSDIGKNKKEFNYPIGGF